MEENILSSLYVSTDENLNNLWTEFVGRFESNRFLISPEGDLFEQYFEQLMYRDEPLFVSKNEAFFRARKNDENIIMDNDDLKAPPADLVNSGRLNPRNIPVLYMAYEEMTAVAETRPYVGARVAIAECMTNKDLKVLDLTSRYNAVSKPNNFRKLLGELFSKPYGPHESEKSYIPTQYLAEFIKKSGFDGVKYSSSLHPAGDNICIFDPKSIEVKYKREVKVMEVSIEFH